MGRVGARFWVPLSAVAAMLALTACDGTDTTDQLGSGELWLNADGTTVTRCFTSELKAAAVDAYRDAGLAPNVRVNAVFVGSGDAAFAPDAGSVFEPPPIYAVRATLARATGNGAAAVMKDWLPRTERDLSLELDAHAWCDGSRRCLDSFRIELRRLDEETDRTLVTWDARAELIDPPSGVPDDPLLLERVSSSAQPSPCR